MCTLNCIVMKLWQIRSIHGIMPIPQMKRLALDYNPANFLLPFNNFKAEEGVNRFNNLLSFKQGRLSKGITEMCTLRCIRKIFHDPLSQAKISLRCVV